MKRAITPGTFDPLTNGHLDVIERASRLFDEVIVAVASSEKKHPLFDLDERLALASAATAHLENVTVAPVKGLLVDFAREHDATVLVKGLRATMDFEYEFAMTAANYHLDENIETLFIMASPKNMYLSSSLVREIASFGNPVGDFVPPCVSEALLRRFSADFARWSEYYASMMFEFGFNSMCKMTIPDGLQGKTVLDVGCRRGKGVYRLAEQVGESGRVIGLDWVPAFITEAQSGIPRAMEKAGLASCNMEFKVGFPEDLGAAGVDDASVDVIWVNSVHNLFADQNRFFGECARVLKPGGLLVCETVYADVARDPHVVEQARALGNSIQSALPYEDFVGMLSAAGFVDVEITQMHEVAPEQGFVAKREVPIVASAEEVSFKAAVVYARKPDC